MNFLVWSIKKVYFTASLNVFPTATQGPEIHGEQHVINSYPNGKFDVALKVSNTDEKSSKKKRKFVNANNDCSHRYNLEVGTDRW